ncbi:hypothetical protein C6A85_86005, partial [Mycobacterium sp. ITM-2017-0098]
KPGDVVSATFVLDGQRFIGINGGPVFSFTEAVSFTIDCRDQAEVDYYWDRLVDGGAESQCGWLKDRYGLSWQVVPRRLTELTSDPDPARAAAATKAMLGMRKIVIAELEDAVSGLWAAVGDGRRRLVLPGQKLLIYGSRRPPLCTLGHTQLGPGRLSEDVWR